MDNRLDRMDNWPLRHGPGAIPSREPHPCPASIISVFTLASEDEGSIPFTRSIINQAFMEKFSKMPSLRWSLAVYLLLGQFRYPSALYMRVLQFVSNAK